MYINSTSAYGGIPLYSGEFLSNWFGSVFPPPHPQHACLALIPWEENFWKLGQKSAHPGPFSPLWVHHSAPSYKRHVKPIESVQNVPLLSMMWSWHRPCKRMYYYFLIQFSPATQYCCLFGLFGIIGNLWLHRIWILHSEMNLLKALFFWKGHGGHKFKLSPANIWILKFYYFTVFAIKMLLDKPYWLMNLLGIKYDHFSSLIQASSYTK